MSSYSSEMKGGLAGVSAPWPLVKPSLPVFVEEEASPVEYKKFLVAGACRDFKEGIWVFKISLIRLKSNREMGYVSMRRSKDAMQSTRRLKAWGKGEESEKLASRLFIL